MNGKEAVEYIHSVSWLGSRPGLDRIRELSCAMGNPEKRLKCIHVAGTNGKGSFCSMLSSILTRAGYKTGLFTSPYVLCFNERIRIDGEMIPDEALGEITEYVKSKADAMENTPTEFELLTAIAFEYFDREKCDFVVLEAGLGGRLDSTNVIDKAALSVITGIDLDHTAILGDTVEAIAREKAGIIKEGCPVVLGDMSDGAKDVIVETCVGKHAQVYPVCYDKIGSPRFSLNGTEFVYADKEYKLSLLGEYQVRNAAVVLTAVDALKKTGVSLPDEAVKRGLEEARWAARFELLSNKPVIIYDGAHNPQGVDAAIRNVKLLFEEGKAVLLTGVMEDKDHSNMVSALAQISYSVHTVKPFNPRAMSAEELALEFEGCGVPSKAYSDFDTAVAEAVADAEGRGCPVIALGSLYMYADVLGSVRKFLSSRK